MISRINGKSSGKLSKNKFEQVYQAAEEPDHNHPYLIENCIEPMGLRQLNNKLVIPIKRNKKVCGLQYISSEGVKTLLRGSKVKGGYFLIAGEKESGAIVVVTKEYATGVTIQMFLKCHVLIAFNANNLLDVALLARANLPTHKIIIAADNEQKSEKNTGVDKAVKAAKEINGLVSIAPGMAGKNLNWNDYYKKNGLAKSKKKFNENMLNPEEVMMTALPKYEACYTTTDGIGLVRASELQMKSVKWLWKGWLAAGKLHLIAGVAGTGKTTIALSLAAAITRDNAVLPDGSLTGSAAGSVLIWSGEDDIEDSLLPRLVASGADLNKVYFVGCARGNDDDVKEFHPDQDIQGLQDTLQSIPDIKLIILDPVVAVIRGDSHKNTEVRKSLQPVVDMAAQLGAAVLGITHLSKGTMGRNPTERVTGSLAFAAVARLVLITIQPQKSGVLSRLVRVKSNIGESGGAIEYNIKSKQVTDDGVEGQFIEWADCLSGTADELLNVADFTQSNNHVEEEWLKEALSDVPVSNNDLKKRAKKDGIAWRGVERAKHKLGAVKKRDGYGAGSKVRWSLPTKLENEARGEQEE